MSADRKGACTLWIALVDLSEDAGTLQFVEGSQEWGPLGRFDQLDDDWVEDHRDAHVRISHAQSLAAGDATLHDALTLHGAGENRSGISRVVYSLTYMPANTLYNGMPHRATDGLNLDLDKPFGGDLFPLVAEPIP
jgi:ectoine hydroxylase-related dioxygenase (phytanoyl-CoA dioxygenase family)